jgi:uncharacterized protein (TIGR00251 family)
VTTGRPWCREERAGDALAVVLAVHAQPGAKASAVAGVHGDALRIRIAAPAVEGKANAELVRFLAEQFGVARSRVTLVRGDSGRRKLVRIDGPVLRPDRGWG